MIENNKGAQKLVICIIILMRTILISGLHIPGPMDVDFVLLPVLTDIHLMPTCYVWIKN